MAKKMDPSRPPLTSAAAEHSISVGSREELDPTYACYVCYVCGWSGTATIHSA